MTAEVPATTAVKRSRVANIDTARLAARADHLANVVLSAQGMRLFDKRSDMVMRAAELAAVENELDRRGVDRVRRSTP